jgi:hypothetical protein
MKNLVTLVLALILLEAVTAARAWPGVGFTIQNGRSGKCLQPADESLEVGAPIIQTTCNYSAIQRWELIYLHGGTVKVRNVFSNLCLDVGGGATNHAPIQQWTCSWISNQRWDRFPYYDQLRSRVSGTYSHCLDVPGASLEDVELQLYRCNGTGAQIWMPVPDILQ